MSISNPIRKESKVYGPVPATIEHKAFKIFNKIEVIYTLTRSIQEIYSVSQMVNPTAKPLFEVQGQREVHGKLVCTIDPSVAVEDRERGFDIFEEIIFNIETEDKILIDSCIVSWEKIVTDDKYTVEFAACRVEDKKLVVNG